MGIIWEVCASKRQRESGMPSRACSVAARGRPGHIGRPLCGGDFAAWSPCGRRNGRANSNPVRKRVRIVRITTSHGRPYNTLRQQ